MRGIILISIFFVFTNVIHAQCFYIKTVLADACGDPEGENEMVFLTTNEAIYLPDLSVDWPNNPFLNWCNAPNVTQQLNQTINNNCGLIIEPINDTVPANSNLLIVTSTNVLINANSFADLIDTLYIVYQCAGNTAGHFSNTANSTRTLQIFYNGSNCTSGQSVSYIPTQLIGGDGAIISYDTLGVGTYSNTGCNAPVPSLRPFWSFTNTICNDFGIIDLNSLLSPNATPNGIWSGDTTNSHFFDPTNQLGTFQLTYTVSSTSNCVAPRDSTIIFNVVDPPTGRDTIQRCDSILQFGSWIKEDTIIPIIVSNPNPYLCDSTVFRFYDIQTPNFTLEPQNIQVYSGEEIPFQIQGNDFQFSYYSDNDSCIFPCANTSILAQGDELYTFEIVDTLSTCSVFQSIQISYIYNSQLNIPTAFTPNGDGVNDNYQLYGKDLQQIEFQLFSKWGELLFKGNSLSDKWDGKFRGKAIESGLLLLRINASGKDGKKYEIVEKVKLIR